MKIYISFNTFYIYICKFLSYIFKIYVNTTCYKNIKTKKLGERNNNERVQEREKE